MENGLVRPLEASVMIHLKRVLGQTAFLGQHLTPDQADAYYRRLGLLMAQAREIQEFAASHPDLARETSLDQDAATVARAVNDLASIEWGALARVLQEGAASQMHANKIDQLAAIVEPALPRLEEARARLAQKEKRPSILFPLLGVAAGGFLAAELFGLTHVLGLRG